MANEEPEVITLDDLITTLNNGGGTNITVDEITQAVKNKSAEDVQRRLEEETPPPRKDPHEYLRSLLRKDES